MAETQETLTSIKTVKFLCSYGGKILPRRSDGLLRYVGGLTRVVSVNRSVTFSELISKLNDLCGYTTSTLRCQLPSEDLDVLVTIKTDEDLAHVIEEYDKASTIMDRELKIRAILSPQHQSSKSKSSPSSPSSLSPASSSSSLTDLSGPDHHHHHQHRVRMTSSSPMMMSSSSASARVCHQLPARRVQYGVVGDRYHHYYYIPCHLQATPPHYSLPPQQPQPHQHFKSNRWH